MKNLKFTRCEKYGENSDFSSTDIKLPIKLKILKKNFVVSTLKTILSVNSFENGWYRKCNDSILNFNFGVIEKCGEPIDFCRQLTPFEKKFETNNRTKNIYFGC